MTISKGTDAFFSSIQAYGDKGEHFYPKRLEEKPHLLRTKNAFLQDWFRSIMQALKKKHESIEETIIEHLVEDNLFFGLHYQWAGGWITSIRFHVLFLPRHNFIDFYHEEIRDSFYFRMDYDHDCLGPFFKEALPHIHICPENEPRFSFRFSDPKTILADFVEFIYRNFFYEQWLVWAKRVSKKHFPDKNIFDALQKAYDKNDLGFLKEDVTRIFLRSFKEKLQEEKETFLNISIDPDLLSLSYL